MKTQNEGINAQSDAHIKQRAQQVIETMGPRYICHPAHRVQRVTPFTKTHEQLRNALGDV